MKDDFRNGMPSTRRTEINVEPVRQLVSSDRRLTVRVMAGQLDMKRDSFWRIITEDLGMQEVCAKLVPKLLNDDHKKHIKTSGSGNDRGTSNQRAITSLQT